MKARVIILVIIGILLTSCGAETATQEIEVAAKASATQAPVTPEPVVTEEIVVFVATESPTEVPTEIPTESPITCVTLLVPENGTQLPATGKVTFSWTPMTDAGKYVLRFTLPSGSIVSFETDQLFRDRYMEAFVSGGEYQWQVIAQDADGKEICVSEVVTFDKPASEKQEKPKKGGKGEESEGTGGSGWEPPPQPTGVSDG